MQSDQKSGEEQDLQQLTGAVDVLDILREEFEQWLEEAQDDSKREALENVLGHVEAVEEDYVHRRNELLKRLGHGD
jgi:tRNA 2-selenouridine synthase SelU